MEPQNATKNRILFWILLAIIFIGGAYFIFQKQTSLENPHPQNNVVTPNGTATTKALEERMKICESIPDGTTQEVKETSRVFINLPEDIYPAENRKFITTGNATAGLISNGEGLMPNPDFAANKCATHSYEFSGVGTVDLRVESTDPSVSDYEIHFTVKKV